MLDKGLNRSLIELNMLLQGAKDISDLRPCPAQIEKYSNYFVGDALAPTESMECTAGKIACVINHTGKVLPCTFLNAIAGDLRKEKMKSIWENSDVMKIFRSITSELFDKCKGCSEARWCNFCYATNLNETGNIFLPSDEFCKSVRARGSYYDRVK